MPMITVDDGASIYVEVEGNERAPALMLSNSLGTNLHMWDDQAGELAKHFRLIRYDRRGHGRSSVPPGPYSMERFGRDVLAILDDLNIAKTHWCGLSMGGMVGLGLMLDHPARIKSAVIADSRHTTTPEFTKAWLDRIEMVRQGGIAAIVASTVERWSSAGLAARNPAAIARMERMIRNTSAAGYRGCAAALARLNYGHRLGEIRTPALVLCGTEDHGAPPENTRQMHAMIHGSRFLEIAQAGHISNIEKPAIFNAAVAKLFDDVEQGRVLASA